MPAPPEKRAYIIYLTELTPVWQAIARPADFQL